MEIGLCLSDEHCLCPFDRFAFRCAGIGGRIRRLDDRRKVANADPLRDERFGGARYKRQADFFRNDALYTGRHRRAQAADQQVDHVPVDERAEVCANVSLELRAQRGGRHLLGRVRYGWFPIPPAPRCSALSPWVVG